MQVYSSDIITQRTKDGLVEVWVSQSMVCQICGTTELYLRTWCRKKYLSLVPHARRHQDRMPLIPNASWRYWRRDNTFYYDLATIPNQAPTHYRSQLPTDMVAWHKEQLKNTQISDLETELKHALDYRYKRYVGYYQNLSEGLKGDLRYAKAAACLDAAVEYVVSNQINPNKGIFWQDMSRLVAKLEVGLCEDYRRLQAKGLRVIAGENVIQVVVPKNLNNTHSLKVENPTIRGWVTMLRADDINYTGSHIVRLVGMLCELSDMLQPSFSWLEKAVYGTEIKMLTSRERFGDRGRMAAQYRGFVSLAAAAYASLCWMMDATRVNMLPVFTDDGRRQTVDGGRKTADEKKQKSVFMVAVTDVHSLCNLSMFFTYTENRWAYRELLCGAVRSAGHLPYELVCDRFPGHNSPEGIALLNRMECNGVKVTITHEANGKAPQERWWRTFQSLCFQASPMYYGEGVKASGASAHRTPDYLDRQAKLAKKEGWDYVALTEEVGKYLNKWNNTPMCHWHPSKKRLTKSPQQMFNESAKPSALEIRPERFAEMFGYETIHTMSHLGQLSPVIEGQELQYKVDEFDIIRKWEGRRMVMCIDLENPDTCFLFEPPAYPEQYYKRYIGTAWRDTPVVRYGPDADAAAMGKAKARIKKLEMQRAKALDEAKGGVVNAEMTLLLAQYGGKTADNEAEEWLTVDGGRLTVDGGRLTADGMDDEEEYRPKRKPSLYDHL